MAPSPIPRVVTGPEALAEFRRGLTGEAVAGWLEAGRGRVLIALPVGVGKTHLLMEALRHLRPAVGRPYDLVVVLVPRRDILAEILRRMPPDSSHLVLRPRPRARCGSLDPPWLEHEAAGCGQLARERFCRSCPRRRGCPWPGQYSSRRLRGAGLIFAAQQHLALDPGFIGRLRCLAGANRVLVLADESDLLVRPARRTIARPTLRQFLIAQEDSDIAGPSSGRWLELTRTMIEATDADFRRRTWRFPAIEPGWARAVQAAGRGRFGPEFRFPAFELSQVARSDPLSRERTPEGDLAFSCPPDLGDDYLVFSGSAAPGLVRYRLDPEHRLPAPLAPFEDVRFENPDTSWMNINSLLGAEKYFARNAPALLDFFAALVARNVRAGRRTLLVTRKRFRDLCRDGLECRLGAMDLGPVRIITDGWERTDLSDPRILPLIGYGISGVNRFEEFEAAYCLNSYYVSAATISETVQDLDATELRFSVRIVMQGDPPRRTVRVEMPDDRESILPRLAVWTHEQKEADVVLQAVGRVRPFTRPRQVITFQAGMLPGVRYAHEWVSLAQARAHFAIPTRRRYEADASSIEIRRLRGLGLGLRAIGERMGVSLSTVKRYANPAGAHETLQ